MQAILGLFVLVGLAWALIGRGEIAALGMRSLVAGALATLMTGAVAALLLWP